MNQNLHNYHHPRNKSPCTATAKTAMSQALQQYVAHENENTAQRKWLVIKRYNMIKHASPDTTPTHLKMTSRILQCRSTMWDANSKKNKNKLAKKL